jgi:hypothetical protein
MYASCCQAIGIACHPGMQNPESEFRNIAIAIEIKFLFLLNN